MRLHIIPQHEFQLLKSFETQTIPFYKELMAVDSDDVLFFLVEKKIAGYSKILKIDKETQAIQLDFYCIFEPLTRLSLQGHIHDILYTSLGQHYHNVLTQIHTLGIAASKAIFDIVESVNPSILFYQYQLEDELEKAEKDFQRQLKQREKKEDISHTNVYVNDASEHTKAQYYLKSLAHITGCDVWMATNDHHRSVYGEKLKEGCLEEFPNLSIEKDALKRIKLIDTIWFQNGTPLFAFEAEFSTAIYSGILRMSDILVEMPISSLQLIIVAPESRREKVLAEMRRPLFRKIGLTSACKFITLENLKKLYDNLSDLSGHVLPSVILAYAETPTE